MESLTRVSLGLLDDRDVKEISRKDTSIAKKANQVPCNCADHESNQGGDSGFKKHQTSKASVYITQLAQPKLLKIM